MRDFLRRSLHLRSLALCLVAIACAYQGVRIIREQREAGVPASTTWIAVSVVILIAGIWGTYRRRSLLSTVVSAGAATQPTRAGAESEEDAARQTSSQPAPAPATTAPVAPARPPVYEPWIPSAQVPARPVRRPSSMSSAGIPKRKALELREPAASVTPAGVGRWLVTLAALGMAALSMQLLRADWFSQPGILLYLGALALIVAAWVKEKPDPGVQDEALSRIRSDAESSADWNLPRWAEIAFVAAICVLALALRVYELDNLVWNMHGDEGEAGTDAMRILSGNPTSPFTTGWFAQPNVYYWSVAIGLKIFGLSLFGLRMSAVLMSLIGFPFSYLLVRRMFGARAAILATLLLLGNMLYLHYSRVQFSNITTPALWIAGFYFLVRGLQTRRGLDFVLAGVISFFSLYFYNGARILPFMLAGLFLYMAIFHRGFLRRYLGRVVLFAAAAYIVSAPFVGYYLDHAEQMNARSNEKLIFNNRNLMIGQYGEPVPIALPGGATVTLPENAFYIWRQFTTTLSMFTYRNTVSSIFSFVKAPVISFAETILLILGMAMSVWRWRDTRFALLLIWFWAPTIAGGVLTIEAPYSDRLAGMFPTLPILVTLMLNKVAAEWVAAWRSALRSGPQRNLAATGARVVSVAAVLGVVSLVTWANLNDYFVKYAPNHWRISGSSAQALAQTQLVQKLGPAYKYYEIGEPLTLDFNYGITKFFRLITQADGRDLLNLGGDLPFQDSSGNDVKMIINNTMTRHLDAVKVYYPGGDQQPYVFNNEINSFIQYTLTKEQIAERQKVNFGYTPRGSTGGGPEKASKVNGFGTSFGRPPADAFPVDARWWGGIYAPGYTTYFLNVRAPANSTLLIDGRQILDTKSGTAAKAAVILARGLHSIELRAALNNPQQEVSLEWRTANEDYAAPAGKFLWDGPLGGMSAEVYPLQPGAVSGGLSVEPSAQGAPDTRRTDGVLDWRSGVEANGAIAQAPFTARWKGRFIAPVDGPYQFQTFNTGEVGVWVDGQQAVYGASAPNGGPISIPSQPIVLTAGPHSIEVRYNWERGWAVMDLNVLSPGQPPALLNPSMLEPVVGVWLPGEVPPPPASDVRVTIAH